MSHKSVIPVQVQNSKAINSRAELKEIKNSYPEQIAMKSWDLIKILWLKSNSGDCKLNI